VSAVAVVYGAILMLAGVVLARGVAAVRADRIAAVLGRPRRVVAGRRRPSLRLPAALRRRAESRAWPFGAWSYAAAIVGSAAAGAVVGYWLAGPVGAVSGAVGGPLVIEAVLSRRLAAGADAADAHLRDVVLTLASATRAGLSIRRALDEAARDAGPPLDAELERLTGRLDVGEPLEPALEGLASRLALPDLRLVTMALSVHRRTGGDLPVMLEEAAEVIGDRVRARHDVRALTAQGRASGAVLAVLPVAFVALLSGTGGEALGAFYRSRLGGGLLAAGLALAGLGFLWIRRIVQRAERA
jgi:tight adherence protein B